MNSKKGFTLFEILTIVVIVSVLGISGIISFNKSIKNSNIAKYNDIKSNIMNAAKVYTQTDNDLIAALMNGDSLKITVGDLQERSLINSNLQNPVTKENISSEDFIYAYKSYNGELKYEYVLHNYSYKVYGVSWNGSGSTLTRTDNSVGMGFVVNASTITSDFDNAEIYKEMVEITDEFGNQFIKIPKFYIKKTNNGSSWTWQISQEKKDSSYYLPACFYDETNSRELNYALIGKYDASLSASNKLESKTGKAPLTTKTIVEFRTYATTNGSGYQLMDIHMVDALQVLFYIEFATLNSQSIMKGYSNTSNASAVTSGLTDSVTSLSGSPNSNTNGSNPMKYRGIENLWGNLEQYVDGININNYVAYVARNSNSYLSNTFSGNYVQVGYTNSSSSGWALNLSHDSSNPFTNLAASVTATESSSPYGDKYYSASGAKIALLGGAWNYGNDNGISMWAFSVDSATAYSVFGSRLAKIPL